MNLRDYRRVYLIGNGGSYANAIHIANDLLACGVPAFTLDPATLTACANDHGYENVFSGWLAVVAEPGDLVIALSGSGQSRNILKAIELAFMKGVEVFTLFGNERGQTMQQAEEYQIFWGHEMMRSLTA